MVTRREALQIIGGTVAGLVVGGVVGYYGGKLSAPSGPSGPSEKPKLKFGVLFPFTGGMAPLGAPEGWGAIEAIEMVNDRGGVLGNKVEYVVADSKSDPSTGASEAERLISVNGVTAIIGYFSSSIDMAVSEVCERHKVVSWGCGEVADKITQRGYKYVFRPHVSGGAFVTVTVDFLQKVIPDALGKKPGDITIAEFHEDGAWGTSIGNALKYMNDHLDEPFNIVLSEGYSSRATDFSSLLLKVKSVNPDIIINAGNPTDILIIAKQMRDLGVKTHVIIGHGSSWVTKPLYDTLGKDSNYILGNEPGDYPPGMKVEAFKPEVRPIIAEFERRYKEKHGVDPIPHAYIGFGNTWVFLNYVVKGALSKFGNAEPDSLVAAAQEVDIEPGEIPGLSYGLKFVPVGQTWKAPWGYTYTSGENMKEESMLWQWFDGKLKAVYPEKFAIADYVVPLPPSSPFAKT